MAERKPPGCGAQGTRGAGCKRGRQGLRLKCEGRRNSIRNFGALLLFSDSSKLLCIASLHSPSCVTLV
jgi:hypothetical protein